MIRRNCKQMIHSPAEIVNRSVDLENTVQLQLLIRIHHPRGIVHSSSSRWDPLPSSFYIRWCPFNNQWDGKELNVLGNHLSDYYFSPRPMSWQDLLSIMVPVAHWSGNYFEANKLLVDYMTERILTAIDFTSHFLWTTWGLTWEERT